MCFAQKTVKHATLCRNVIHVLTMLKSLMDAAFAKTVISPIFTIRLVVSLVLGIVDNARLLVNA